MGGNDLFKAMLGRGGATSTALGRNPWVTRRWNGGLRNTGGRAGVGEGGSAGNVAHVELREGGSDFFLF